jgi:hypothetical protein
LTIGHKDEYSNQQKKEKAKELSLKKPNGHDLFLKNEQDEIDIVTLVK